MASSATKAIQLGPARLSESEQLAEISRRSIEAGLDWRWRAHRVAASIRDENVHVVAAREAERIVGFAMMSFRFEDAHAHLLLLGVIASHRRAGIGTRLADWLEVMALRGGIRNIMLEVRETAGPARRFYASRGFVRTARMPGYYQQTEAGLRLAKRL